MYTLEITPGDLQAAMEHAAASYPEECCGFLIGRFVAATELTALGGTANKKLAGYLTADAAQLP